MNDYIISDENVKILFVRKRLENVVFRYSYRFKKKIEILHKQS